MKGGAKDRKPAYIILGILALAACVTGIYAAYAKLHAMWIEQCKITDVARQVTIVGNKNTNEQALNEYMGLKPGANLALIDFGKKREETLQKIPGVKSLSIQRHLPDKIEITVEERVPVARMNFKGSKRVTGRVVDTEGVVFQRQPGTSMLPFIYEDKAHQTPNGGKLAGRQLAALRLVELAQEQRFASLGILSIDTTHKDFLVATLGNYARANIAWENMDSPTSKTAKSMETQYRNLFDAIKSDIARHRSGAASAIVWNATQPGLIYADTKEPIQ